MHLRAAGLGALLVLVGATEASAAPTAAEKAACIGAFDEGQHAKSDHRLKLAQTQLLACTKEACPPVLRADCAEVLKSVQAALPSVVLAADDAGHDVTDVKVTNGTETIAATLDGKSIELDPGTYDFKFERGTDKPVVVHFVLREGEKSRTVRASFGEKKAAPLPPPPPAQPMQESRGAVGYAVPGALAALGVAGFVLAGVFRLSFSSQVADLRAECAPVCTQAQRDELSSKVVLSNVSLGIGIGGLALAVASWFVLAPGARTPAPTTAALTW